MCCPELVLSKGLSSPGDKETSRQPQIHIYEVMRGTTGLKIISEGEELTQVQVAHIVPGGYWGNAGCSPEGLWPDMRTQGSEETTKAPSYQVCPGAVNGQLVRCIGGVVEMVLQLPKAVNVDNKGERRARLF